MRITFYTILAILLSSIISFSQTDSVTVSTESIINAATTIVLQRDSIEDLTIRLNLVTTEFQNRERLFESVMKSDSAEIAALNQKVEIYSGIMNNFSPQLANQKWYNSKWVSYSAGLLTAFIGVHLSAKLD
jgi:hypothetical protein